MPQPPCHPATLQPSHSTPCQCGVGPWWGAVSRGKVGTGCSSASLGVPQLLSALRPGWGAQPRRQRGVMAHRGWGGRAGAFGQPSGVRAAAAVGAHVNITRVRGGRSAPHVPAPSACPHPLLHQSLDSSGCDPFMRWQHPTVAPGMHANPKPPHAVAAPVSLALPAQPLTLHHMQPCAPHTSRPHKMPTQAPLPVPVWLHHLGWATCVPSSNTLPWAHCSPCPPAAWAWTCRPIPGMLGRVPAHGSTALLSWQPGWRAEGTASPTGTCCWKRRAPSGTLTSPGTPFSSPAGWQCWGHTSEAGVLDTFGVAVGLLVPVTSSPSRAARTMPTDLPQCHHPLAGLFPLGLPFSGPILQGRHDSLGAFRQNNPPPAPPLLPLGIPGRAPAAKSHFRSSVGPHARGTTLLGVSGTGRVP